MNHIYTLQAFQDDVEDLTEELDYLLDKYEVTHPFVVEIADYLAIQVKQWQSITQTIEQNGARIASWILQDWNGMESLTAKLHYTHGRRENLISSGIMR